MAATNERLPGREPSAPARSGAGHAPAIRQRAVRNDAAIAARAAQQRGAGQEAARPDTAVDLEEALHLLRGGDGSAEARARTRRSPPRRAAPLGPGYTWAAGSAPAAARAAPPPIDPRFVWIRARG